MVAKNQQAKSRHHYVWGYYLKKWSLNDRDVFYRTKTGKVVCESIKGVAVKSQFYKINYIHQADIKWLLFFSYRSPIGLREIHFDYLNSILYVQMQENRYKKHGQKSKDIDDAVHVFRSNTLEDLHSNVENTTKYIIDELANRNYEILQNNTENMIKFMHYLGLQSTRTDHMKQGMLGLGDLFLAQKEGLTMDIIDRNWWYFGYVLGLNLGTVLFQERFVAKHSLLINDTGISFITSDHPAINVHPAVDNIEKKALAGEEYDLYYPISPTVAYFIGFSDRFDSGKVFVTDKDVQEFNIKMAKNANVHIFGDSNQLVSSLLKYVGAE